MSQGGNYSIYNDTETSIVITKPCWICGQHSRIPMPTQAWNKYNLLDQSIDAAWPQGSVEDKQLLRTGIHPKCWDEEFPDNDPKEN